MCNHKRPLQAQDKGWSSCLDCGCFLPFSKNTPVRLPKYYYNPSIHPQTILNYYIEQTQFKPYLPPTYLKHRKRWVENLVDMGECLKAKPLTIQIAVYLFDRVNSLKNIKSKTQELLAAGTLKVAIKFEEELSDTRLNSKKLKKVEMDILKTLDWKVNVITPFHFVEFYNAQGVVFSSDTLNSSKKLEKAVEYVKRYSEVFAELVLLHDQFLVYSVPNLGASCIAAARKAVGFKLVWNPELQELTKFSFEKLCCNKIWEVYRKLFLESMYSSGVPKLM